MTAKPKTLKMKDIKNVSPKTKLKLHDFNEPDPDWLHVRLDVMTDQTIYIVKLEQITSDDYGPGYKLHFRDIPGAKQGYTAACFGLIVDRQLEPLYVDSHMSADISEKKPFKVTVRKAGRSYRFE